MEERGARRLNAVSLRKQGLSLKSIAARTGVPLSTLSGWLRGVVLTERQETALRIDRQRTLVKARAKAAQSHHARKENKILAMKRAVDAKHKNVTDISLEIALAMLYLGEGSKTRSQMGMGNSDPKVIRFYVNALGALYGIEPSALRVELHLRADQDEASLVRFWSRESGIPKNRFTYVVRDKRTEGKPTYPGYKGVCFVAGGGVEIQRRLLYLAEVLCRAI